MKLIKLLILSFFLLTFGLSKSQGTVIFSESIGSSPSTTLITSYTGWQNSGILTFTGSGDVRNSTASTGYINASGTGNVFLTNISGRNFIISGFTSTGYNNLNLSLGIFKNTTTSSGNELTIEYSTTGVLGPYTNLSKSPLPTGTGTAIWHYLQIPTLPVGTNSIRFTNTSTTTQFRIDDILLEGFNIPTSNGLVINEVSQGELGNKEYIEMVVNGYPCTTVDIRGWIIDDNNGSFSNNHQSQTGVAAGYLRFSDNALWSAINTGTIILIYDSLDVSSSITTTFDNNPSDYRLIIPIKNTDSTYFIGNNGPPSSLSSTYSTTRLFPNFNNQISLKNSYDAIQTRSKSFSYFHGVSYSDSSSNSTDSGIWISRYNHPDSIVYKNNTLIFTKTEIGSGSNRNYYINDSISYDFKDKRNWITTTGSGTRTPGESNNAKNNAWINYLIGGCLLPIEISKFYTICNDDNTTVYFSTLSQSNVDYFYLQKSRDGSNWADFAWFKGKKYSSQLDEYRATDDSKYKYYYRIKEVDLDGTIIYSNVIYSSCLNTDNNNTIDIKVINNNILNIQTNSNQKLILTLYSIDGKLIKSDIVQNSFQTSLDALSRGIYVASLISESGQINIVEKILIK